MKTRPRRTNDPDGVRRNIVDVATREFAQKGYGGARVDAIANRTRTSKRMIYYYFGSKERLYLAVLEGAYAAITGPSSVLAGLVEDDKRKRDLVVQRLNQMPGVRCALPEGTIYAFPNVKNCGVQSQKLAEAILEEAHVVVEAGSFYGAAGEGHLRVCFGSESLERIEEGMNRLSRFFNNR